VTSPPQHDDPVGEARTQLLQTLAVLTTVGEAAARFAVTGAQNRAARAEQRAHAARIEAASRERADQLAAAAHAEQDEATRRLIDKAFDQSWLDNAGPRETAELWRAAAIYAAATGNARARDAMRLAETRLHQINPTLMNAYARHRAAGLNLTEAIRAAAQEVLQHLPRERKARPHSDKPYDRPPVKAIGATPDPRGQAAADELDAAVAAEVQRLAEGVDPDLIDRVQRQWRSAGHTPAADAASLLAHAARQLRAEAHLGGPTIATATIRRGPNHPSSHHRPPATISHDAEEVPIRSTVTGYLLAADHLDRTAAGLRAAHAEQAEQDHLTGLADQQLRRAAADQAQPDLPETRADERTDGLTAGHTQHGRAEHDQAVAQRLRLSQAFPPLTRLTPTFSHPQVSPPAAPTTTRRRGSTR
jgi:hypothetical protein